MPVTHAAKQENNRRSPRSVGISRLPFDLLPCAAPSCHSKDLAFVRCPTHESSQIVSRLPHDLDAHCARLASSRFASHRALHETDIACRFAVAARRFAGVVHSCLAVRRSYATCWIAEGTSASL